MKRFILSVLVACPMVSLAADEIITCEPPQGTRIDYFSYNKINLQNNTFLMGRDQVQGMKPKLILHEDRTLSFVIGDATETTANTKAGNMKVLIDNKDQLSFVGTINDAPVLGTYYPKNAILIYSQQSIWPGPDYQGARAVIFYSKCGNNANTPENTVPSMGTMPVQPMTPASGAAPQTAPMTMTPPAPMQPTPAAPMAPVQSPTAPTAPAPTSAAPMAPAQSPTNPY